MAHLGMQPAVQQAAVDERASAQACTNGDIQEAVQTARGAPAGFGQRRGVHVGVEGNRRAQSPVNGAPAKSKFLQSSFGVEVMYPKVGDAGFGSMGPKDAIPMAATGSRARKNSATCASVSAGIVVGNSET